MNDEALEFLKEDYNNRRDERERKEQYFTSLLQRKNKLEKNPIIVKYLKLLEEINNSTDLIINDEELLEQSFKALSESGLLTETNKIYFYYGTYKEIKGETIIVPRNSKSGEYDIYKDIESGEDIKNPVSLRDEFERNNEVIIFIRPYPAVRDFESLHEDYLITSMRYGQEEASKKVLSRKY